MPLQQDVKQEVIKKLEEYEGRVNHLYLDSVGKITVGIGHLVTNRLDVAFIAMYKTTNNIPSQVASLQDKQTEYDYISKQRKGYNASWYKQHTKLVMKDADIDVLRGRHLGSFYKELTNLYKKSKGYPEDFDKLPKKVQMALFDMIFNLGATRVANMFPNFNRAIKENDWSKAAQACNRPDVSAARNEYVKRLFLSASQEVQKK